eukprot:Amastigsp_a845114_107.p3 type:complete len:116 gc:universal Amastigsp_a845114_107:172-519(+)
MLKCDCIRCPMPEARAVQPPWMLPDVPRELMRNVREHSTLHAPSRRPRWIVAPTTCRAQRHDAFSRACFRSWVSSLRLDVLCRFPVLVVARAGMCALRDRPAELSLVFVGSGLRV